MGLCGQAASLTEPAFAGSHVGQRSKSSQRVRKRIAFSARRHAMASLRRSGVRRNAAWWIWDPPGYRRHQCPLSRCERGIERLAAPYLGSPGDVLAGDEEELVLRAADAALPVWLVLDALVERLGGLLRGPLDDQERLGRLAVSLDSLDAACPRPGAAAAALDDLGHFGHVVPDPARVGDVDLRDRVPLHRSAYLDR